MTELIIIWNSYNYSDTFKHTYIKISKEIVFELRTYFFKIVLTFYFEQKKTFKLRKKWKFKENWNYIENILLRFFFQLLYLRTQIIIVYIKEIFIN